MSQRVGWRRTEGQHLWYKQRTVSVDATREKKRRLVQPGVIPKGRKVRVRRKFDDEASMKGWSTAVRAKNKKKKQKKKEKKKETKETFSPNLRSGTSFGRKGHAPDQKQRHPQSRQQKKKKKAANLGGRKENRSGRAEGLYFLTS